MRKIFIGISIFLGIIFALLLIGFVSISRIVTPDFIVRKIENTINARADLKKININLFSALSSIELEGLSLHNRDNFADNAILLVDRTTATNPLISIKKVDLQLNFLAILRRNFQLKKFILVDLSISVVLKENGNNLSYLLIKPKTVEGKPNIISDAESKDTQVESSADKPFSVRSLPISTNIDKIGIQNGTIDIFVQKTLQKISLKNVNLFITDIDINPEDLEKHNSLKLNANLNASILNSGGQETALFLINSNGLIIPFIAKSGAINPSINYHLTLREGSYISGLSLMDALAGGLPILANVGIKMDGLSKKADIKKDVSLDVNYSGGKITLLNQAILPTPNYDFTLAKDSWIHVDSNQHYFTGGILASKLESEKAINGVDTAIKIQLKQENPDEIRNKILGDLVKNDRLNLPFTSSGNIKSPNVQLAVSFPSILDMAKGVLGDKLKEEIKKNLPGGVEDTLNKGLKKLF